MRRTKLPSLALMAALLLMASLAVQLRLVGVAAEASGPSLVISQLKMTSSNGQFITLYNATNTQLDMGKYQLEYFNNYDLAKATSSKLISLTGLVPPHGYFMVNDSSQMLCYQLTVDSVSLGLSSTAGMIEVLAYNQTDAGGSVGGSNDAVDEFIEVYNPNVTDFDLSGFSLQAGTTTPHAFKLPNDTTLPAQSFTTFYAGTTHLSLSNSGGQVKLLDPTGAILNSTYVYDSAKDGQAWALANGNWYWTTQPTPGEPNMIEQPVSKAAAKAKTKASDTKATTKKSAVNKAKVAKATQSKKIKKPKAIAKLTSSKDAAPAAPTPIHSSTIAVVVGLALLYGAYEYRADLANRFHQLKRHLKIGRGNRRQA